jgi:GTP-binding protein HflX
MVSIRVGEKGIPGAISYAHILTKNAQDEGWNVITVPDIGQLNTDFQELIQSIENEFARTEGGQTLEKRERAVLLGVTTGPTWKAKESLEECGILPFLITWRWWIWLYGP